MFLNKQFSPLMQQHDSNKLHQTRHRGFVSFKKMFRPYMIDIDFSEANNYVFEPVNNLNKL